MSWFGRRVEKHVARTLRPNYMAQGRDLRDRNTHGQNEAATRERPIAGLVNMERMCLVRDDFKARVPNLYAELTGN